jgi:hypothetical protein
MRIQHWLAAIMSLLGPMVVGSSALAQQGPAWQGQPAATGRAPVQQSAYHLPAPDPVLAQTPMVPPPFQPAFTTNNPNLLYPPGAPYGAQPWPAMSPHLGPNVMQDQTYNQNGLWLNNVIHRERRWYGDIDYVHTTFDGAGEAWIGSRPAKLDKVSDDFPFIDTWPDGGPIGAADGEPIPIGPGPYPFVFLQEDVDDFVGVATVLPPEVFPIRKTDILDDNIGADGFRVRAGYFDNDGTGLGAEFWYGFQGGDVRQYGQDKINGIPITQDLIAGVDFTGIPFNLRLDEYTNPSGGFIPFTKVGALALNDSSGIIDTLFPGAGFTGTTQKYDLLYRVEDHISGGGGDVKFFLGNVYKRPHAQIRSFTAIKYIVLDESFQFRGLDSGFHYVIDLETGDDEAPTFRPEDGEIIGPLYPLFESTLRQDVTTHLAGPEIGLRGDIGQSKGFKLWWTGAVGLLVNHTKADLRGQNIGDPTDTDDDTGFGTVFGPAFDMFSNNTKFHDTDTHTQVSPSLQIGINAEIGIFDVVPGIRRMSFFDDAKLNLGYNTQIIGQVARAADSVMWRGFPDFPSVSFDYDTFQIHQLSIGLHFER